MERTDRQEQLYPVKSFFASLAQRMFSSAPSSIPHIFDCRVLKKEQEEEEFGERRHFLLEYVWNESQ